LIGAVNGIIRAVNTVGFDVPSWVPVFGGKSFRLSIPSIPYLATGAYVPPNAREFMAVLGDNNAEGEYVAPESKLKAAVQEAMAEMSGTRTDELLETLIAVVQNKHLLVSDVGKAAVQYANGEYYRTGETVFEGV